MKLYNKEYSEIFIDDSKSVWEDINPKEIQNAIFLITGGTGLIGSTLVRALLYANYFFSLNLKIILPVRNIKKAKELYGESAPLKLVDWNIAQKPLKIDFLVDYIVHCANPTSSGFFVEKPVDTIDICINGTKNILEIARKSSVKGVLFLSSMEVYGYPKKGIKVTEEKLGGFDVTLSRNSYPVSKQLCENLCCAYATQYNVPTKIIRLSQTFGPGISYDDERIFAQFARCAKEKRDIVLVTQGLTERSYLYTRDAVTAILTVLLFGESGQAYNVANSKTYCSIYNMAEAFAKENGINVIVLKQDIHKFGYADTLYINLDTHKIEKLNWHPKVDLMEMFSRMMKAM